MGDILGQFIIETETYHQIRAAIEDGISSILVTAGPGMGKTTLLRLLERDWLANGDRVCFVGLRAIQGETDLLRAFQEQLEGTPEEQRSFVVESSADEVAKSLVTLVNSQDRRTLILLDGLDEALNARSILRAIRLLLEETRAIVVLTARPATLERETEHLPFRRVELRPFSDADVAKLFAGSGLNLDTLPLSRRAFEATNGSPLLASILASTVAVLLENGDYRTIDDLFASPTNSLRLILDRILKREAVKFGVDSKSLIIPLARLAIRGSSRGTDLSLTVQEAELLRSSPLVRRDGEVLRLSHNALTSDILAIAGALPPRQTHLRDIEFGAEEAERDSLLTESFIDPPGVDELRLGRKNIVVGDRGAGKSALFSALIRTSTSNQDGVQVLRLEDPAELMLRLESRGEKLATAEQFRAAWLLSFACTLAVQLDLKSPRQQQMAKCLRAALPSATQDFTTSWLKLIWSKIRRTSVKFQLGPIVLESPKVGDTAERGGQLLDIEAFLHETALALKTCGRRVFVAVDRIDEVYKYNRDLQERLVQGLFLAESGLSRTSEIGLLIFIRTDLFEIYDIQEKNKLVTRTLRLHWTDDRILQMIVRRIFSNQCFAGLAEIVAKDSVGDSLGDAVQALFPAEVEGQPFTEWLWRCLKNGNGDVSPRQLILLLVLIREIPEASTYTFEGLPIFSEEVLRQAMNKLSELSFDEIINDFRVATVLLRSCRAGKLYSFELSEIEQLFDKSEGSTGKQVELLERLGVFERIVTEDHNGQQLAKFRIPPIYTRCWTAARG